MVNTKRSKNRNSRSLGRRHASQEMSYKKRKVKMQQDLADAGLGDYSEAVRVHLRMRTTGRDEGRLYPSYSLKLADGKELKARSRTEMLKKVNAFVDSAVHDVRAKYGIKPPAAEEPAKEPAADAVKEPAAEEPAEEEPAEDEPAAEEPAAEEPAEEESEEESAEEESAEESAEEESAEEPVVSDEGVDDDGGFEDDGGFDEHEDAAAAAKERKLDKLKKMLQDTLGGEKERPFDGYKRGDVVEYTDPEGKIWMGVVEGIKTISDKAARTSSSKRFDVRFFSDGSLGLAWPKHLTLLTSIHRLPDGAVDLTMSSDDEEMDDDLSSDDEEMDEDSDDNGSSSSSMAI